MVVNTSNKSDASGDWVGVPFGHDAERYRTLHPERYVLVVARTLTTTDWLLDILNEVLADPRIQVAFTVEDERPSVYHRGATELLRREGALMVPWSQAVATRFDLAISSTFGGSLHQLRAPLLIGLHGPGIGKPGVLMPGKRIATPDVEPGDKIGPATTVMLSHAADAEYFGGSAPARFVVSGDPCFDRLAASSHLRTRFSDALGLRPDQRLVFVSSTWGPGALFADPADLLKRLPAELSADRYRIAAVLHPNIWIGHSEWQVRSWISRARDAGVLAIPPWRNAWRSALVASDVVVHDHGSVGFYAAALGKPVVTAEFRHDLVMPDSAMAELGQLAPALDLSEELTPQIEAAIDSFNPASLRTVAERMTEVPGRSLQLHRDIIYDLLNLDQPPSPPRTLTVSAPADPLPPIRSYRVTALVDDDCVKIKRQPALTPPPPPAGHGTSCAISARGRPCFSRARP